MSKNTLDYVGITYTFTSSPTYGKVYVNCRNTMSGITWRKIFSKCKARTYYAQLRKLGAIKGN